MAAALSILAFASSIALTLPNRSRSLWRLLGFDGIRRHSSRDDQGELTKTDVMNLREKHFIESVTVSYANSGPLMMVRGEGSRLFDESGKSYLDTRNNVAHVGHEHPKVVQAIQKQVAILNTNTRYLHPNVVKLAERLCEKLPPPLNKVVFVNSGSEANDLALRLARAHTGSKNTIVVDGAYHGHTLSVLEISPYKYESSKELKLMKNGDYCTPGGHVWKVPCPDVYRGQHCGPDAAAKFAAYVESACLHYRKKGESVGAFIIEGGMSVAGVILPPSDYLETSVAEVRKSGGLYIADEVQTGFGRLGSCYWAFQHDSQGVVPDIVTVGKPFGNGMPLAAVITSQNIADSFQDMNVEYFATFGGNPVSAAAGLAVLDVMREEQLQEHALIVGDYLKAKFRDLQARHHLIGDVRGSGLFLGVELVRNLKTKEPATAETSYICTQLKQKYCILSSIDGLYDNVIVIKPPLMFSKEDADIFAGAFEQALGDLEAFGDRLEKMSKTPT